VGCPISAGLILYWLEVVAPELESSGQEKLRYTPMVAQNEGACLAVSQASRPSMFWYTNACSDNQVRALALAAGEIIALLASLCFLVREPNRFLLNFTAALPEFAPWELPWAAHACDAIFSGLGNRLAAQSCARFPAARDQL